MSRKTKRHPARRHHHEAVGKQGPADRPPFRTDNVATDKVVAGEIMGALLNAITFGALEPPASAAPERAKRP